MIPGRLEAVGRPRAGTRVDWSVRENGGTLVFRVGVEPNEEWGVSDLFPAAAPLMRSAGRE